MLDIFVFKNEQALQLQHLIDENQLKFLISAGTLNEFKCVIQRTKFKLSDQEINSILHAVNKSSVTAESDKHARFICKDKEDQKFFDLAATFPPSLLISKDKKVLKGKGKMRSQNVTVTSVTEAIELLKLW